MYARVPASLDLVFAFLTEMMGSIAWNILR